MLQVHACNAVRVTVQGDLEYAGTVEEKARLQAAREKVQSDSESLSPLLNILYLQLQLLQHIQEGNKVGGLTREVVLYCVSGLGQMHGLCAGLEVSPSLFSLPPSLPSPLHS